MMTPWSQMMSLEPGDMRLIAGGYRIIPDHGVWGQ